MSYEDFRPRDEIIAAFKPTFSDFTKDFEDFFDSARRWGRDNADRLRAADEERGYSDEAIGVIERDSWGAELYWLQGVYFERGLHDLVARHLMERPFWDREYRELPWTLETKSNKRVAESDGIPLEQLREAFSRFETDGRGDLAVAIWLHVTEEMLGREIEPQDAIDTFDLCRDVVERCGNEAEKNRMKGLSLRLPSST